MSLVYWDTMLFVYWLEDHEQYGKRVQEILIGMEKRGDGLCTSAFTVGEILVGPRKKNDAELAAKVRAAMREPYVRVLPFTVETAERYASLRATQRIAPSDAIHLASAGEVGADLFLTNDRQLAGTLVPGVQFVAGLDVNLY